MTSTISLAARICSRVAEEKTPAMKSHRLLFRVGDFVDLTLAAPANSFAGAAAGRGINVNQLVGHVLLHHPPGKGLVEDRLLNRAEWGEIDTPGPVLLGFELRLEFGLG